MDPNLSRQPFVVGLAPDAWVVVMQDMEGTSAPATRTVRDRFHNIAIAAEADPANTQPVEFAVQDSDDGLTWTTVLLNATALVPGGHLTFTHSHVRARFRVLAFSHGQGQVKVYLAAPENQANPEYIQRVALTCASYCEVACETGAETGD